VGVIKHTPKDNRYYNYVNNNDNNIIIFIIFESITRKIAASCRFLVAGRGGDGGVTRILNRRARGTVGCGSRSCIRALLNPPEYVEKILLVIPIIILLFLTLNKKLH